MSARDSTARRPECRTFSSDLLLCLVANRSTPCRNVSGVRKSRLEGTSLQGWGLPGPAPQPLCFSKGDGRWAWVQEGCCFKQVAREVSTEKVRFEQLPEGGGEGTV